MQTAAQTQRDLKTETERLADSVEAAEVFAIALRSAASMMQQAADRLAKRETDRQTLARQQAARQRFLDLLAALKSDESGNGPQEGRPQPGQQPPDEEQQGGDQEIIAQLAQLKLLKTLQEDLLERTAELDRQRRENGRLTPEQEQRLEQLASEQGRLADIARNLTAELLKTSEADVPSDPPVQER